jgi:spore maturation protein CgeB
MRIVMFYHSLSSDWNHGNAHFLRGVCTELRASGHEVAVYEPEHGWSRRNLVADHGERPIARFRAAYPGLAPIVYDPGRLDLDEALEGAEAVIVHEWNPHVLVAAIGERRARGARFALLFHDTHHRAVTAPDEMGRYDLSAYDGVLAFGGAIAAIYAANRWARRVWTWHEAADTRVFAPRPGIAKDLDLVWVGNWGDEERSEELREHLMRPVRRLRLRALVHGVRYPAAAIEDLAASGIEYGGWLANFDVPEVFARARVTVHVPRRPYASALPGIPTIRVFEALACGIPLVSAPWEDREGLFRPGVDFLVARDGREMERHLRAILAEPSLARELAARGRETILSRHTCAHRAAELLGIIGDIIAAAAPAGGAARTGATA